jgi:acyl-CoA synthetase (AMP-forming)/AMP-acid ligase II
MQLASILERAEQLYPERIAVRDGALTLTYRQVANRARSLAGWLETRSVTSGTRVAALELNTAAYLEAYFACARLGAVLVPLNFRLSAEELTFILADSGAVVLLASPELSESVHGLARLGALPEHLLWLGTPPASGHSVELGGTSYAEALATPPQPGRAPDLPADALAHLYYTSGTTGRPKGVMLTHGNVWTHALATVAELGLSDADTWAHIAPMFHLADAWATFAITWVGGRHVMVPRFEEEAVFRAIEVERTTLSNLIPTMLNRLVRHPSAETRDYSSLRRILSGGAPIAPEVVREIMRVMRCEYVQTYGMTETSPYLTFSLLKEHLKALPPEEQFRFRAKTGRPCIAVELEVIGDDGRPVPHDGKSVGEIRARGATVTPGYWNRPDETAKAFVDGWLCTGDLATIDAEGYLDIVDRKKDMIISGGEKVFSTEVEHVLYSHPAVLEAAVFGLPDVTWGESVTAAIVLRQGTSATAHDLIAFCRTKLTHYKCPRAVHFLAELPKTGTAKIQKRALRERFAGG